MTSPVVISINSVKDLANATRTLSDSRTDSPVEIRLERSEYTLDAPVVLGPEASGTRETPLILNATGARLISTNARGAALIQVDHASHIHIQGATFEGKVQIDGGSGVTLDSCTFQTTGGTALSVSAGARDSLTRCDHRITDCIFRGTNAGETAIDVEGVGTCVENTRIESYAGAITYSGNEHLFRRNHIHDVSTAIHTTGGDWTERGNVIRDNRIHDVATAAIALEDLASGTVLSGNLIHDCAAGVVIEGGRNHRITNNIFANCQPAIRVDGKGDDGGQLPEQVAGEMKTRFESMSPLEPPYAIRYPDLKEVAAYYLHELGIPPEGNLINRNICVGDWIEMVDLATPGILATQSNFTDSDPGFADLDARDFTLPDTAEVYELGFRPVQYDDAGPRRTE